MLETLIIILSVIIDQITKYIASIKLLSPYDIIPGVIRLHYVKITVMAFGLLKDQTAFLAAVSVIMTGVMIYDEPSYDTVNRVSCCSSGYHRKRDREELSAFF
ncbi:MAG: signal peptidase II [Clostridiales bacterium]|nr:signal peptidase II [Clostridiales bacterium]